jgi:IS30 family transposase
MTLLRLPHGRSAEHVRDVLTREIKRLPQQLRRSLTWDQGKEMAEHVQFAINIPT